jgi:hypothetical protein
MSWNTTFIAINRDFSDQLNKLQTDLGIVLGEPLQTISWEEATSSSAAGKSVGSGSGWTIICARLCFLTRAGQSCPSRAKYGRRKLKKV